jgi:hypothetical protein
MVEYSINIITYNRSVDLARTLKELQNQIDETAEVLVIDNSHDGNAKKVVEKIKNKPIRYFKNNVNQISKARNIGIKNSKGKYIVNLDDDCIPHQDWFSKIKKHANSADAIMGKIEIPKSTYLGDCISALGYPGGGHLGFEKMWKVDKNGYTNQMGFGNSIFRKEIIGRIGLVDENFKYGAEDTEFSHRIRSNGYKIKYVPDIRAEHKPRTKLSEFVRWHITRGRSNYYLKQKVKRVGGYIKLRAWSTKNLFKTYALRKEMFLIPFLFGLSVFCQYYGYYSEKLKH